WSEPWHSQSRGCRSALGRPSARGDAARRAACRRQGWNDVRELVLVHPVVAATNSTSALLGSESCLRLLNREPAHTQSCFKVAGRKLALLLLRERSSHNGG